MIPEKWRCGGCGKTWEIECLPPGSLAQIGDGDFHCPSDGCNTRLLDDPAMNDETTLPGLIGAPIRYREVGTVQWYEVP
jgi:hypothetical protein